MNFASDNWPGATPAVMAAIARHNDGFAPSYGGDDLTATVTRTFCELFETELEVHFTATGTAANALSMAAAARPGGLIFCSGEAHLFNDEMGASEFFTGGMKLIPLAHQHGLVAPATLEAALARYPEGGRGGEPVTLSLTQASECGTLYPLDQIRALSGLARERDMTIHMDGARFANAVAALGATPAEISWRSGVDIMSFGGTKNGCWAAEAILVFSPERFRDLGAIRQRAGQVMSKARFVAAQFEGYLGDDSWLTTARHANEMARRLRDGIHRSDIARLGWEPQANEVFAVLRRPAIAALRAAGAMFHPWSAELAQPVGPEEELVRLVTSFATTPEEVTRFLEVLEAGGSEAALDP